MYKTSSAEWLGVVNGRFVKYVSLAIDAVIWPLVKKLTILMFLVRTAIAVKIIN